MAMQKVDVTATETGLQISPPVQLFPIDGTKLLPFRGYDVHSDGRFLMASNLVDSAEGNVMEERDKTLLTDVIVVDRSWMTELQEKP